MVDLDAFWRSRLKLVVENLVEGEREHREIASLAEQIGTDYHGRFLVELVQNANDQAVASGNEDATVLIVRTEDGLGVLNQGRPFNEKGVRDITSIGLTQKSPDVCLGNKGIGFKAVFEVSRSPEIYSAPHPGSRLTDPEGTRFRLDREPFSDPSQRERAREMITDILEDRNVDLTADEAVEEAARAAPFKYPLKLSREDLKTRLATLSISEDTARRFQTLVFLPLSEGASEAVDSALRALVDERGAAVLFLDGVSRIQIHDQTQGTWCELARRKMGSPQTLRQGSRLQKVLTWRRRGDEEIEEGEDDASTKERMTWWKASREIGARTEEDTETPSREREALQEAAKNLPGEAWQSIDTVPVAVALPRGRPDSVAGEPLGADGLFCIGLPTEMPTGMPIWLHSHFHGNISRTEIDLEGQAYNTLLFKESMGLLRAMLECLQDARHLEDRRLVTLAMERSSGPVTEAWYDGPDVRTARVILAADGESYVRPFRLTLPDSDDAEMLRRLLPEDDQPADYGFVLPEEELLMSGRDVLEELIGKSEPGEEARPLFLKRQESEKSLIERGAEIHRDDGLAFWMPFLDWLHDRFPVEDLDDQKILPVGTSDLRAPEERVFFRPSSEAGDLDIVDRLDAEASTTDLPFVDEHAVRVRNEKGDYTELATKLAPERGARLVRRPRALDLINDAIAPYMAEALSDTCDSGAALAGLQLALRLTDNLTGETRAGIRRKDLRVPTGDPDSAETWMPPTEVYFGPGWVEEETNELLAEAFGDDRRRLISWSRFTSLIKSTEDRDAWKARMKALGVEESPKIRTPKGNRPAPLKSYSKEYLSRDESVPCPLPGMDEIWVAYLETIRDRPVRTTSGQSFDVDEVVWIDGLEDPESRSAVMRLMLIHAQKYRGETETVLRRVKNVRNRDRSIVPTLWVHALRSSNWSVIPTTQGLVSPSEAWIVPEPSRSHSDPSYRILPVVSDRYRFADADVLLEEIGVRSRGTADAGELVRALHQIAGRLKDLSTEDKQRAEVLAKDIYADIQNNLGDGGNRGQIDHIVDFPIPLVRHDLEAVDVKQVDVLYLNDDPIRGRFVPGLGNAPKLPTRTKHTYGRLLDELRRVLGEECVRRTTTAEVETGFQPFDETDDRPLPEELEGLSSGRHVQLDLAAIVIYLGPNHLDPRADTFQQLWNEFNRTRVVRGSFPPDVPDIDAFYDRQGSDSPVLQLRGDAASTKILKATWQLFGERYRDAIELYAGKLSRNEGVREFFEERGVNETEFHRLREIVEGTAEVELQHAKALGLLLARRRKPDLSIRAFDSEWDLSTLIDDELPFEESSVESLRELGRAIQRGDERRIPDVLSSFEITMEEWQSAREELGSDPWQFQTTAEVFENVREGLVAEVMALAARRPSVDPDRCQELVASLREAEPPSDLLHAPRSQRECREAVLSATLEAAEEDGLIVRRLREELETESRFLPTDVPDRDVSDFRQASQRLRTRRAKELLNDVLDVAEEVAETKDEKLDRSEISDDPRVELLTQGWLASHYALAPVLRERLADQIPETAEVLVEAGAFQDRVPKSELWRTLPEVEPPSPRRSEPQPSFNVFGEPWQEDQLKEDLASASQGSIGAKMRERASDEIDLRAVANRERESVSPTTMGSDSSGSSGSGVKGSNQGHAESRRARELNGLLGEVFAFEQLRQALPGFDSTCWVSENRTYYGHEDPGSDAAGFDFLYTDLEGMLTPNEDAACEIEVKSSSESEPGEFTLTQNEMNRARECHQNGDRQYIIVWIANVRDAPALWEILVDPIGLWEQGLVDITARGGRMVRVPQEEDDPGEE